MEAPQWFQDVLARDSDGRLRVRWSHARECWQVEQKVERAQAFLATSIMRRYYALPEWKRRERWDDLVRARDGFVFVMEVRPGTSMPCPRCHFPLSVPALRTEEVRCGYCQVQGRDVTVKAGHFPLGEVLLDYLRKRDPLKGGIARMVAEADKANDERERVRARDLHNTNEAILKQDLTQLFEIPHVGYTGKEHAWVRED